MSLQLSDSRYSVGVCFAAYHSGPIGGTGALARPIETRRRSKGFEQRSKGENCRHEISQLRIRVTGRMSRHEEADVDRCLPFRPDTCPVRSDECYDVYVIRLGCLKHSGVVECGDLYNLITVGKS